MNKLSDKKCAPCDGDTPRMTSQSIGDYMKDLNERWENENDQLLVGLFRFKNYYQTQAFVNAVAYIAHCENHHPDISFGYNTCRIELTTHAIDGLSENDFISAAKIDRLVA